MAAANRCAILLCLALVLVSAVSAWSDYERGRRDSQPGQIKNRFETKNVHVPKSKKQAQYYGSAGEEYNKKYHHAGDWAGNQQSNGASFCDRFAHDPYKYAKCQAQRTPRQPAKDPRCQRYVYDDEPHKLPMCEQRAQGPPTEVPQCQQFEYDPYKVAKCEHKAQKSQGAYQGGPLKAPQCGRYVDDLYKLSQCEDRAEAGATTQVPQCQQYVYDPYKLAKCEHKAEFWNDFKFDPAHTSTPDAACQRYSYDPYKMQRCEYKIKKMMMGQSAE